MVVISFQTSPQNKFNNKHKWKQFLMKLGKSTSKTEYIKDLPNALKSSKHARRL